MDRKPLQKRRIAARVDWIIPTATAIGLLIVVIASIQAGEQGLIASLVSRISLNG